MRRPRLPALAAAAMAVGAAVALGAAGGAAAGTTAAARRAVEAAVPIVTVQVGDTLRAPGSRLVCPFTRSTATSGVLCLLAARLGEPLPRSYAVGLAEDGEAILVVYDAHGKGSLVTRFTQAARGAARRLRAARVIVAKPGGYYRLGTTDVVCAVGQPASATAPAAVLCFKAGPQGPAVGSIGIAITDGGSARIFRVTGAKTVRVLVEKREPPR